MTTGKVLYTDGHKVVVTDSTFQVNKSNYLLEGIIRHYFITNPPNRLPVVITICLGLIFLTLGMFNAVPGNWIAELEVSGAMLTPRILSIIFGVSMIVAGVVLLIVVKEKYSVHILTAEGEKEVIVSRHREYVTMIHEALSKALQRW